MICVQLQQQISFYIEPNVTTTEIKRKITDLTNLPDTDFYLTQNGKILEKNVISNCNTIQVNFRLRGGKGGFGSMLRAIGAQIEKTTNREACRDLSGRRLRDINEEKRLKKWIEQQAERERDAVERKKKKLERLCEKPKYEFKDAEYDRLRSELPEVIEESVSQGFKVGEKRKKLDNEDNVKQKKKKKLWMDDDLEDLSSSSDDSEETEESNSKDTNSIEANVGSEVSCSSASTSGFKEDKAEEIVNN